MVVSEIGEQWSPHTAPAIHAEIQMIASGLSIENTFCTIGISMPKVPQEVPVANARPQPITNTMAGRNICIDCAEDWTKSRTKYFAPRESVMDLRLHAKVSINIAGTIALKPSGIQPIISLKDMERRTE